MTVHLPTDGRGVGARIEAETAAGTEVRWWTPATTWSTSAPEVVLGLGGERSFQRVVVTLRDGTEVAWEQVEAGAVLDAGTRP